MCMRLSPSESGSSGILFVGFNQDYSCFAVGTQNGFRIFNSDPLKLLERYEFDVHDGTGVGYLEMLYRTNVLGILGGGYYARLPNNVACLWDGIKKQFLLEITCSLEVKAVRLRRDRIIIVLLEAVKVFTFGPSPRLIYEISTCVNPLGLCQVCQVTDNPLLAFPGRRPGDVLLVHVGVTSSTSCAVGVTMATTFLGQSLPASSSTGNSVGQQVPLPTTTGITNATNLRPPRQIVAHDHALAALVLNATGSLLATASQKGTLVRVFSTKECELLHEMRRGINPAVITSLSFDHASDLLCVTSERGTAHVFSLSRKRKDASAICDRKSVQLASGVQRPTSASQETTANYFTNVSQVRCVLETRFRAVSAFSLLAPNILIVLAADGSYYKYSFTPNGSVTRIAFVNFLDFYDDEAGI